MKLLYINCINKITIAIKLHSRAFSRYDHNKNEHKSVCRGCGWRSHSLPFNWGIPSVVLVANTGSAGLCWNEAHRTLHCGIMLIIRLLFLIIRQNKLPHNIWSLILPLSILYMWQPSQYLRLTMASFFPCSQELMIFLHESSQILQWLFRRPV